MPGRELFLFALLGCSSPAAAPKRSAIAPTPTEVTPGTAFAPSPDAAATSMPQSASSSDASSPQSSPRTSAVSQSQSPAQQQSQPYTFKWEEVRKRWEKSPDKPACAVCRMAQPTAGWCCLPGGKPMRAAKVNIWRIEDGSHTWLELDIGSEALITDAWHAALVDEQDHLITEWVQLKRVARDYSEVIVPVGYEAIDRVSTRVALVAELPR